MSSRDICPALPQFGEWAHSHIEEQIPIEVQWAVDKGRKRLLDFIMESSVAEIPSSAAVENEDNLENIFIREAEIWDRETAHLSSTPKKILHESYQRIMAMGPDVVPYMLRDLQNSGRSWFWALRHLTQANPVPPDDQGNLDKMVRAWVAWGKREGRI
jgi:hypothetical protein